MTARQALALRWTLAVLLLFVGALPSRALEETGVSLSPVHFDLAVKLVPGVNVKAFEGTLVLRPTSGGGEPVRLAVGTGKEATARLAAGTVWNVEGEIPGFWVRRSTMTVAGPGAETVQRIELWPLGHIAGRIRLAEKAVPLKKVFVTTLAVPGYLHRPAAPKGLLGCPVDKKGAWSCSLPAASYDLTVSAPGFVPHYLWGIAVPAGKSLDLGSLELQRGASVAGWVAVEAGPVDPGKCLARLSPLLPAGVNLGVASRAERMAVETKVRKDGFFQLLGLAPGSYQLEIRQPSLAPARVYPIQVASGKETFLPEPILLHPTVSLELSIDPPLDWMDRAWHVQVSRAAEGGARFEAPVFDAAANAEGHVRVPGQATGRFEVRVADSLGNRFYRDDNLRIESAEDAQRSIKMDLVTIQGKVELGSDPLAATLWFGGTPNSGVTVKMEADREGRFHGVLPKTRLWQVGVKATDPKIDVQTRAEVHPNPSGLAKVDIVLPDTRVFGKVVDEGGTPVPNATVSLLTKGSDLSVAADEKGGFEARGIPEGDVDLAAESARNAPDTDAVSDKVRLALQSGQPAGPIELRLRRMRTISGKVLSSRGPVGGAVLDLTALGSDAGWLGLGHATSDFSGAWSIRVPAKAIRAQIVVSPPGNALRTFDIPVDSNEAMLSVSEEGGTLDIALPYSGDEFIENEMGLHFFQNGVSLPSLGSWAGTHEGGLWGAKEPILRIPALAPGEYEVCVVPYSLDPVHTPSTCATGQLSSGGTLRLKLHGK